jgi:hypothetical protein
VQFLSGGAVVLAMPVLEIVNSAGAGMGRFQVTESGRGTFVFVDDRGATSDECALQSPLVNGFQFCIDAISFQLQDSDFRVIHVCCGS